MNAIVLAVLLAMPHAPPSLSMPAEVRGDVAEWVSITARTEARAVRWIPLDKGLSVLPGELMRDTKTTIVVARTTGRYRLLAITCMGDEMSEPAICTVVIGETQSPPAASGQKRWLVVIEETGDASVRRGAFFTDRALSAFITSKGWDVRVADRDALDARGRVPADLMGYIARAGRKLPYFVLVDGQGKIELEGMVPSTPRDFLAILQRR